MLGLRTILPIMFASILASCAGQPDGKDLNATDFDKAIAMDHVQLVDVRTAGEYASGHLEGALSIDWTGSGFQEGIATLDKDKPVLLYCASGRRSAAARSAMEEAGFKDVKHLDGGIGSWTRAGKPVVR